MMKIKHLRWLLFTCLFFSFQAPERYLGKAINIIFQDSQDRIWVGTNSEGVFCREKGIVHHYTTKDGIREAQILAIQEDAQGQIWVQGSHYIYKFEKTLAFSLAQIQHAKPYQPDKNQNKSHLWFGFGGGAYHFDGKLWSYLLLKGSTDAGMPENPTPIKNINPTQLNSYSVYCTLFDKQGNLWLGTQSMGVCCYQADGAFKWLTEKGLKGPAVRAIFQDSKGNYWFGNNGGWPTIAQYDRNPRLGQSKFHQRRQTQNWHPCTCLGNQRRLPRSNMGRHLRLRPLEVRCSNVHQFHAERRPPKPHAHRNFKSTQRQTLDRL
jgi:ligand-binding sensor domain-containing protein